jgi:hypothetical protein
VIERYGVGSPHHPIGSLIIRLGRSGDALADIAKAADSSQAATYHVINEIKITR